MTVQALAERYAVSEGTVLGWIARGDLKAVNVGRRADSRKPRWRVAPEALAAFEAARTAAPPAPKTRRRTRRPTDVIEFYHES